MIAGMSEPPEVIAARVATVRAFLAREADALAAATAGRRARLRGHLPEVVRLLHALGAERVWLFGSLADRPGWAAPTPTSDLDLAVAGLPGGRFFEAYSALWDLVGEAVDLVDLDDAPDSLRERILADGEALS